jgi:hypothetical protein
VETEFAADVVGVGIGGALADHEYLGDLWTGQAAGDQTGDLVFAAVGRARPTVVPVVPRGPVRSQLQR